MKKLLKKKQQQIDNSLDSTDNEKEVALQALAKKRKALAAIDQAQTNSQVNQAATDGITAIKMIQPETKSSSNRWYNCDKNDST